MVGLHLYILYAEPLFLQKAVEFLYEPAFSVIRDYLLRIGGVVYRQRGQQQPFDIFLAGSVVMLADHHEAQCDGSDRVDRAMGAQDLHLPEPESNMRRTSFLARPLADGYVVGETLVGGHSGLTQRNPVPVGSHHAAVFGRSDHKVEILQPQCQQRIHVPLPVLNHDQVYVIADQGSRLPGG